jgi:hypothetical protein
MSNPIELDDKTLALLVTLSDLSGQSHSIRHIVSVYIRSLEQVQEYRKDPDATY